MRPRDVERKLLGAAAKWPKLLSPTTTPPSLPPPQSLPILPDELIEEILTRLPVKSLLQFRSVCKSWNILISGSQFAKDHLQRSTADPTMTHPRLAYSNCHSEHCYIRFFSTRLLVEKPSSPTKIVCFRMGRALEILGSCNGLLCLHALLNDNYVSLWNPCIGFASKWLKIEPVERLFAYHGFGYDHVHDKYKALVVLEGSSELDTVTQVFPFGANSWKTIENFPFPPYGWRGKFVSGTLNWIVRVPGTTNQRVILSFDLVKETYGQVSLPDVNDDNLCYPVLEVLRNCLCVCFDQKTGWDVWLMKEYGAEQSWTRLVMISHVDLRPFESYHYLKPLYISEDDLVLARPLDSNLVLYNSNDSQLHHPMIERSSDDMLPRPMSKETLQRHFHVYYESLVSPSHYGLRSCFA